MTLLSFKEEIWRGLSMAGFTIMFSNFGISVMGAVLLAMVPTTLISFFFYEKD